MGMMDKAKDLKDKAMDAVSGDDKIDAAADKADEMTGGQHSDKIDKGQEMAEDAAEKIKKPAE